MRINFYDLLKKYKTVIPIIQRDYAQGRTTGNAPRVREMFLEVIYKTLKEDGSPLELDFIYGYIKNDVEFIPLDGQQRLTTLFLLHWFYAAKEGFLEDNKDVLNKFTYETRHSSELFCAAVLDYTPDDYSFSISEQITDQPWFFSAWNNDPTVKSMLVMLDAIQAKDSIYKPQGVWEALSSSEQAKIEFNLLPMNELGLPDELYIKMNSRGKELTEFEYFKSRFAQIIPSRMAEKFNKKIDQEWSDMFWSLYRDGDGNDTARLVDKGFMRFFNFFTEVVVPYKGSFVDDSTEDSHGLYKDGKNTELFFKCLDYFYELYKKEWALFDSLFYIDAADFSEEKTRLFFQNKYINLLKSCMENYDSSRVPNPFPIGEQLMLFGCIEHLFNQTDNCGARMRVLRNLIEKSEDTVRKENLPSLLDSVSLIMREGIREGIFDTNTLFNSRQVEEEKQKSDFMLGNPSSKGVLSRLEDHDFLRGCLAIFDLRPDLDKVADVFISAFDENGEYDYLRNISNALLIFGDYTQESEQRARFPFYRKALWRELFSPSQKRHGFEKTKATLYSLLDYLLKNPGKTLSDIIESYLQDYDANADKPKDWRYYYIKYPTFRHFTEGYYYWENQDKPYECLMLYRKTIYGHNWSPFLFTLNRERGSQTSLENYGDPLLVLKENRGVKVLNRNKGYKIEPFEDENSRKYYKELQAKGIINNDGFYLIRQNADGIDLDDRIVKGLEMIDL